jgi:hypothetical protein
MIIINKGEIDMKAAIFNPFSPIPKSPKSHTRGGAIIWSQRLNSDILTKKDNISDYDLLFWDHGPNFAGSPNLFGGVNDEVAQRILEVMESNIPVMSLDHKLTNCTYNSRINTCQQSKSTSKLVTDDFIEQYNDWEINNFKGKAITQFKLNLNSAIVGDSHVLAYSKKHQSVHRVNGQLLYSAIKNGLSSFIKQHTNKKNVTLCLGSIDARFHVLTNDEDPVDYAYKYIIEIKKLIEDGYNMSVCAIVPIEHEGRKIPNTGKYKKQPFVGNRHERLTWTVAFNSTLMNSGINVIYPPLEWYSLDGEQYAKEHMELGGSVHISPLSYNSVIDWEKSNDSK